MCWMMLVPRLDPLSSIFTIFFLSLLGVLLISTSKVCCTFMENYLLVTGSHLPAGEGPWGGLQPVTDGVLGQEP